MLQWGLLFQLMGFKVSLDCNKGTARATRSISRPSSHLWTAYLIPVYKKWVQIPYEIKWPSSSSGLVSGCFYLSFGLGVLKGLCWVLAGVEGILRWGVEQKLMKGLFFFTEASVSEGNQRFWSTQGLPVVGSHEHSQVWKGNRKKPCFLLEPGEG